MKQNETKLVQNSSNIYTCNFCNYSTSRNSQYERHLLTSKHILKQNETSSDPKKFKKTYTCDCGINCNSRTTLWRHKKQCGMISCAEDLNDSSKQQQLVEYLLKENSEFKQLMIEQNKQMIELAKNAGNNNNSHNTNNFNLNFFLNETCKNAMNIMDFVSQLQVGIKELEDTGRLGFAEGISKIFINGLKEMDVSDRPIHCSDSKREVVYIKDKDQWNKESDEKIILTNAIKQVARKNIRQISEWTKENPEFNDSDSKQNDRYLRIVSNSMNGINEEETNKNYNKIIKNIVKETVINK